MTLKSSLFLGLSILTCIFIACDETRLHRNPPPWRPTLNFIFPSKQVPANSRLMIVFVGAIDASTITFRVSGVDGTVTAKNERILFWEPFSPLPLGPTTLEISGKSVDEGLFSVQTSLELEVVAPDLTPPTPVETTVESIEPGLVQFFTGDELLFVFSEPVNWFDAKASFEPNVALNRENQPAEIQSELFVLSGFPMIVVVHLTDPLRFQKGVDYQVTLQGITDLAGNPAGDVQRVYKLW